MDGKGKKRPGIIAFEGMAWENDGGVRWDIIRHKRNGLVILPNIFHLFHPEEEAIKDQRNIS